MSESVLVAHEHQRLVVASPRRPPRPGELAIDDRQWEALAKFAERTGTSALRIGHRSIRIGHHVGYLQLGGLRLEVLPKLDRVATGDWRALLVHMLREVLGLRIAVHSAASLRSRHGTLYDVLVGRFLVLVAALLREGLTRGYREIEGNEPCLRGRLVVDRHVRTNAGHQERLYVAYNTFDADTLPNRILLRALESVLATTPSASHRSTAEALVSEFPEVGRAPVRTADFARLRLDGRMLRYAEAIELARLLLFGERPDLRWGGAPVLALLFDMNALFEAYVLRQLRRVPGVSVRAQAKKIFWLGAGASAKVLKPDLVVSVKGCPQPLIVDTKWKVPKNGRPSDDDLRQLFAYLRTFGATRGLLLYPRASDSQAAIRGTFAVDALQGSVAFVDLFREGAPDAAHVRESLEEIVAAGVAEEPGPTPGVADAAREGQDSGDASAPLTGRYPASGVVSRV